MSNNSTEKLNGSLEDKVDRLLVAVLSIDSRLSNLEVRFDSFDARLSNLEVRFDSFDARLSNLEVRFDHQIVAVQSIDSRLSNLETKVDQRLRETQPIWEGVQAQLTEVLAALKLHGELVASLRADTEKGFRTFDRRMERQIGEFERLHAYQRDLEDRVDKIEKLVTP